MDREVRLRDYQLGAVEAVEGYWRDGQGAAPLVVAPTGSGKSVMIAALVSRYVRDHICEWTERNGAYGVMGSWAWAPPREARPRIMLATHVRELVEQDVAALERYDADLARGVAIWSASLSAGRKGKSGNGSPITAGTIQTIARRLKRITEPVDLLVVDEAHLIPTRESSQYRRLIAHLRSLNPGLRTVGFTATPYRLDQGLLHEGKGAIFDGIAHSVDFLHLINAGHLVPARPRWEGNQIDESRLRVQAGDYTARSQSEAMDLERMVSDALGAGGGGHEGRWLWFLPSVESARSAARTLRDAGFVAQAVDGSMNAHDRDEAIGQFREGEVPHLTNCSLMTTGFDIPEIDRIVLARATRSTALYVQMVGRGLRPAEGKDRCTVLDYGGNVMRHGPIDSPQPGTERRKRRGTPQQSVMRQCMACHAFVLRAERTCPECGHIPPPPVVHFDPLSGREIMLADGLPEGVRRVTHWRAEPWNTDVPGRVPCVRASFSTAPRGKVFRTWYFPHRDSKIFARSRFLDVWSRLVCDGTRPEAEDMERVALDMEMLWPCPDHVRVEERPGRLPDVTPIYRRNSHQDGELVE